MLNESQNVIDAKTIQSGNIFMQYSLAHTWLGITASNAASGSGMVQQSAAVSCRPDQSCLCRRWRRLELLQTRHRGPLEGVGYPMSFLCVASLPSWVRAICTQLKTACVKRAGWPGGAVVWKGVVSEAQCAVQHDSSHKTEAPARWRGKVGLRCRVAEI